MSLHLGVTHYAFAFGAKLLAKNGLTKEFCEKKRYKIHRQIIEFQLFKLFRGVSFRFKSLIIA